MIPAVAHFVWIGRRVSFVHWIAAASAAKRGDFSDVVFHHLDSLEASAAAHRLAEENGVTLAKLDAIPLLEAVDPRLVELYRELEAPAARSNVLRVALLMQRGGVYLDTDTVTLRSFQPLRARAGAFCGEERLVFPGSRRSFWASRLAPPAIARVLLRDVCRRVPAGYRWFRHLAPYYPTAVNNAVLGAEPGHPFLLDLVERMLAVPPEERRVRFALGTHLLQRAVRESRCADLEVLPPDVFYPLGPEISEHWFKARAQVRLEDAVRPETLLVHWYASVRTEPYVSRIDHAWIGAHAGRELFSTLVLEALGGDLSRARA
jgi:hypothetical protein